MIDEWIVESTNRQSIIDSIINHQSAIINLGRAPMVVVMEERASESQIEQVVKRLVEMGMDVHRSTGVTRTVLGAVGQGHPDPGLIEMLDGVHEVLRITSPYKLASRTFKQEPTVVTVGDVRIGGDEVIVIDRKSVV